MQQADSHPTNEVAAELGGAVDIETALNYIGVGPFHLVALVVCGLANAADAVEILGMSLVLPAAETDPGFELTAHGKSALSSCIFLGMLLGGVLWGPLGDVVGRRQALLVALLINAFFGIVSAGARGVGALVTMRLLGGVGVGGSVPVVFSYLAELLPAKARGRYMVCLAAHWMVGSIFSAGMGWAIIPRAPDAWRLFLVVASLPAWCAAVGTWFMPESPRYLLVQGYTGAAEQVLYQILLRNHGKRLPRPVRLLPHQSQQAAHAHALASSQNRKVQAPGLPWEHARGSRSQSLPTADLPAPCAPEVGSRHRGVSAASSGGANNQYHVGDASAGEFTDPGRTAGVQLPSPAGGQHMRRKNLRQQQRECCRMSCTAAGLLLQQPLRRRFLPLMVAWLGLCGGWYSTVLWIPEYFKARGAGSTSLYAETFAVAAANLPGNIASIFMVDRLGRRLTACVCLAGACAAALLFAFAPADPVWSVAAACIFNGISVGGWNALDLLSAELFATEVRSTAMGLLGAAGRLSSFATTFMAGALMQWLLWSPLLVAAALLAAGSIAVMLLPEKALKPLEDTIGDLQDSEVVLPAVSTRASEHADCRSGNQPLSADQRSSSQLSLLHSTRGGSAAGPQAEQGLCRPPAGQHHHQMEIQLADAFEMPAPKHTSSRRSSGAEEEQGLLRSASGV